MLLLERVKENVAKAATEAIAAALPAMMDAALPELPSATGGAIPLPKIHWSCSPFLI